MKGFQYIKVQRSLPDTIKNYNNPNSSKITKMFLNIGEDHPAQSSSQLCAKIFCLCRRLEVSKKTGFNALLLANNYLGPGGNSAITPNSKKRVSEPMSLVSAASVLAALTTLERQTHSEQAVLEAATGLFEASFAEKVTLEHLKKSAQEILSSSLKVQPAGSSPASPTTAQLIEDLHAALPTHIRLYLNIKLAFLVLESLCLAKNNAAAVLLNGGALAAGAVLGAAFCLESPSPQISGSEVLSALSTLTGFPEEVIFAQSRFVVMHLLTP